MTPSKDTNDISPSVLEWSLTENVYVLKEVKECSKGIDWAAICQRASLANDGKACTALPVATNGGNNLVRLIEFEDGTRCVARVQLRKATSETSRKMQHEIDTMALLRTCTTGPSVVPRVLASECSDLQPAGVAYMLLEFLPGNAAMEQVRNHNSPDEGRDIPRQYRDAFHRSLAAAHVRVRIASARLPQIGMVSQSADGTFTVGPIPGIGGPFDTAASFIQAWAGRTRYPYDDAYLRKWLPPHFTEEVIEGIAEFPGRLAKLAASGRHFTSPGPFPVRHPDLWNSNVIVNPAFVVLGVIDWEGAHTVPWELVDGPWSVKNVPRLLNPSEQYDEAGQPLSSSEAEQWAEQAAYARMVKEAEHAAGTDDRLSLVLTDGDGQDLACTIHLFEEGKMGFYGRVMDYLENK